MFDLSSLTSLSSMADLFGFNKRSRVAEDFLRWYDGHRLRDKRRPEEYLPAFVEPLTSRHGVFGSRAERMGTCTDAEAQPPAPCAATDECRDLLALARKFEGDSQRARDLAANADAALRYAQTLLRRAEKGAAAMLMDPQVLHASASEGASMFGGALQDDEIGVHDVRGPIEDNPTDYEDALTRTADRWDLDKRTDEYIRRAEGEGPTDFILTPMRTFRPGPMKPLELDEITPAERGAAPLAVAWLTQPVLLAQESARHRAQPRSRSRGARPRCRRWEFGEFLRRT